MEEQKYYSITDIVKKYDTTRATMYYRFGQLEEYVHLVDETKVINQEGMDILIKELDLKERVEEDVDQETEDIKDGKETEEINSSDNSEELKAIGNQMELIFEHMQLKDKELELKEREIERLHEIINTLNLNIDKALELNKNNQVLLLEKNKQIQKYTEIESEGVYEESKPEEKNNEDETNVTEENSKVKKSFWSRLFSKE